MLKSILSVGLMTLGLLVLSACSEKSSSNNSGTSTQCLTNPYTGLCDNTYYNSSPGFQAYRPGQMEMYYYNMYGAQSQLCSCPNGSRPVYNGQIGIGCAQSAMVGWAPTYYHQNLTISGPTYNQHYVNIPQMSNINQSYSNYNYAGGNCFNNVAWSCLVGRNDQCHTGSVCQAQTAGATVGICVRQ